MVALLKKCEVIAINIQNEPILDISSNLSAIIRNQFPQIKFAQLGWPDRKTFQVERNLPAIFFADISEKGEHAVSQYATHRITSTSVIQEKLRLHTMIQMTLFTNDKLTRDQLGWKIKQYFVANFRFPLIDYTLSTPLPTGEYMLLSFAGDRKEEKGEANFWRRDITFVVQSRVLDAVTAYPVTTINTTSPTQTLAQSQAENPIIQNPITINPITKSDTTDSTTKNRLTINFDITE